jgi:hypothetical protein
MLWRGQTQNRENNPMQSRMAREKGLDVATQPNLVMHLAFAQQLLDAALQLALFRLALAQPFVEIGDG